MGTAACPATCPPQCGTDQMVCPGFPGPDGCMMPGTCATLPTAANPCPVMCPPPPCGELETYCDNGMDENGCWLGAHCLVGTAACPATCPVQCGTDQTVCPGFPGPDGCMMPGTCAALPTAADPCPVMCPPAPCNEPLEIQCDN